MKPAGERQDLNHEGARDIKPFRTASIMINSACNLECLHCDLPEEYKTRGTGLSADQWAHVVRRLDEMLGLALVAISAREPLMPGATRKKTLKIVQVAKGLGKITGVVTNGTYLQDALPEFTASGLVLDYLDVSIEGPREIDERIRGKGHFEKAMAAIDDASLPKVTEKLFISFTLNAWNCSADVLQRFIYWMVHTFDEPRLAVLGLYPNRNVPEELWLTDEQFLRSLEVLLWSSNKFADIFIDAFPSSIPGFHDIIEKGYLPGGDELLRDRTGMLWGHVGENLYVRYENVRDLMRYQVRITPEGRLIMPQDMEKEDYGCTAGADVLEDGLEGTLAHVLHEVDLFDSQVDPRCLGQRCLSACRGENLRCSFIRGKQ